MAAKAIWFSCASRLCSEPIDDFASAHVIFLLVPAQLLVFRGGPHRAFVDRCNPYLKSEYASPAVQIVGNHEFLRISAVLYRYRSAHHAHMTLVHSSWRVGVYHHMHAQKILGCVLPIGYEYCRTLFGLGFRA